MSNLPNDLTLKINDRVYHIFDVDVDIDIDIEEYGNGQQAIGMGMRELTIEINGETESDIGEPPEHCTIQKACYYPICECE